MPKAVKSPSKKGTKKTVQKVEKVLPKKVVKTSKPVVSSQGYAIVSPKGEEIGTIDLPKEIFNLPYNAQLISQAIRIYRMNQREGSASTKTRGMVQGSTRKIYKQKGTGRARHGGIRAPIFVGGGIIFGPQSRDIHGDLPKTMRKHALSSALSHVVAEKTLVIVDGLKELPVKTKAFAQMLQDVHVSKRVLFVYGDETKEVNRAAKNIRGISVLPYSSLNTYAVMHHAFVVFSKDALISIIAKLQKE